MDMSKDMEKMRIYYAKSANENHGKILNRDHLKRVAELARIFGEEIGMPNEAALAGDFHDFGKYGDPFQCLLEGCAHGIDHAFAGAAFLYGLKKLFRHRGTQLWKNYEPILEAIQGHHDGLQSLDSLSDAIEETLRDEKADCCPSGKRPSLRGQKEFLAAQAAFQRDFSNYRLPKLSNREIDSQERASDMLDTRMLFSCLVDADYSVSASDDCPDYLARNSGGKLDADVALEKLYDHLVKIRSGSTANTELNKIRSRVFLACGQAGEAPVGLYTLTAPTGVGKTLAMLHFALRQCKTNHLRRIIVVLPFLTLAEQTEKEYRHIFPEILVDHSQKDLTEDQRELADRWEAPVIITTSVRFFESLFSDNPRDCRKLHNIAGSVILFDEAQSLPPELAAPTVEVVRRLCRKYHCTMVFSTATQPDFSAIPGSVWEPTEILPENAVLFEQMRRVQVQWRFSEKYTSEEIGREMAEEKNVCCIVNLRRHARSLFIALRERVTEGAFLLTTDLCPGHRLTVVEEIKRRQKLGLPCYVVATQCIEAGVDLDFDVMYRTLAPLESIIQAAGRCNRNGKLPGGGRVVVFEPEDERPYPGDSYGRGAMIVKELWTREQMLDLCDPMTIRVYYQKYFSEGNQSQALQKALQEKSYPKAAEAYRLIANTGVRLIVPWAERQELFDRIRNSVQEGRVSAELLREAAPITISCFDAEAVKKCAESIVFRYGKKEVNSGCYILNTGFEAWYDSVMGFQPLDSMHQNLLF